MDAIEDPGEDKKESAEEGEKSELLEHGSFVRGFIFSNLLNKVGLISFSNSGSLTKTDIVGTSLLTH